MSKREDDPRVQRTQADIVRSFNQLLLARGFDEVNVADVVDGAGVGRSTFYEHFRNKDELLEASVTRVLLPLADAVTPNSDVACVQWVLEHFQENRGPARQILNGPSAATMIRRLADLIEERLETPEGPAVLPRKLMAVQIAEAQLGLVRAWLNGVEPAPAQVVAEGIVRASRGMVGALGE